jgi:hypothetical protein
MEKLCDFSTASIKRTSFRTLRNKSRGPCTILVSSAEAANWVTLPHQSSTSDHPLYLQIKIRSFMLQSQLGGTKDHWRLDLFQAFLEYWHADEILTLAAYCLLADVPLLLMVGDWGFAMECFSLLRPSMRYDEDFQFLRGLPNTNHTFPRLGVLRQVSWTN